MHQAALALIVIERIMPGRAIVPERNRALLPAEARLEFGARGVLAEVIEQRLALLRGPAFEVRRERRVDVERWTSTLGMADHDGMHGILRGKLRIDQTARPIRLRFQ